MRRKIHIEQTHVVFHYNPRADVYNQTRNNIADLLKVRVMDYTRTRLWVAVSDVKRLSVDEIQDRIESLLDTAVIDLGYNYKVTMPTIHMPLNRDVPTPFYPVLSKLRKALASYATAKATSTTSHMPHVGLRERGSKTELTLTDIEVPNSRELERIIRSVI